MGIKVDKWYRVLKALNSSLGEIDGVRRKGAIAPRGAIIPGAWFNRVPQSKLTLVLNDLECVEPYQPEAQEYLVLYTLYPAMLTSRKIDAAASGPSHWSRKWYQVSGSVLWGVAALVDVDGVCLSGDVASSGDVIPSQWCAALDTEQFRALENLGYLAPYKPDPFELSDLYERYPGAHPDYAPDQPQDESE